MRRHPGLFPVSSPGPRGLGGPEISLSHPVGDSGRRATLIAVPRAGLRGKAEVWALPTHPHPRDPKAVESKRPFLPLPNPHTLSIILTGSASCLSAVKHELKHRKYQHGQPDSRMPGRGQGKMPGAGPGCLPQLAFCPSIPHCTDPEEADIPGHFKMPAAWKHPSGCIPEILRKFLGYARELWGGSGSHSHTQVLFVFVAILHS